MLRRGWMRYTEAREAERLFQAMVPICDTFSVACDDLADAIDTCTEQLQLFDDLYTELAEAGRVYQKRGSNEYKRFGK